MGYCVINQYRGQIAWCKNLSSAYMMAMEFGCDSIIIENHRKIHRKFVSQIRKSWL